MVKRYKVKVNGKDRALVVSEQTTDKNGLLQQELIYDDNNDHKIVIKEIEENGSHRVVIDSKMVLLPYVAQLLEVRVRSGTATQLEKVAHYEIEHMLSAEAEQIARLYPREVDVLEWSDVKQTSKWKKRRSDPSYKKLNLSHEQITGKEPLPDLDKEFPWRTSYFKFADGILRDVKNTNANKRHILTLLRGGKYEIARDVEHDRGRESPDDHTTNGWVTLRYDLALQEKSSKSMQDAKDRLGVETPTDDGTERLVAAAKTRDTAKKGNTKTKATEQPMVLEGNDFDMG